MLSWYGHGFYCHIYYDYVRIQVYGVKEDLLFTKSLYLPINNQLYNTYLCMININKIFKILFP